MRLKLSVLAAVLIGPVPATGVSNEGLQTEQLADRVAMIAPADKPGAPIDSLLEAHNSYLIEADRRDLRALRSAECAGTTLASRSRRPLDPAGRR